MRRCGAALIALAAAATGCADDAAARPVGSMPTLVVPARLGAYDTKLEPSADKAFAQAGKNSLTAEGAVWTFRRSGEVQGALQVGVLKPEFDTKDIDVRRGVRANIQTGQYRWFKVEDQWVGVQDLAELRLYLWFPARGDLYEVLQLKPDVPDQKALLREVIRYQEGKA